MFFRSVLSSANRWVLRERCIVTWLDISPEAAAVRAGAGNGVAEAQAFGESRPSGQRSSGRKIHTTAIRPLLADGDILERMIALDAVRRPLYRECADIVIQVEGKSPAVIVEELYAALD